MEKLATIFRFGPFELRPRTRELYKHGIKIRLRPQPFQVLHILLERMGDVVTREELHQQLWSSDTFVDFEQGLNTSVKELRGVLGDSACEPRYVQTLPKLGYRMIVPVDVDTPRTSTQVLSPPEDAAAENLVGKRIAHRGVLQVLAFRPRLVLLVISIVLVTTLSAYFQWSRSQAGSKPIGGRLMLAVLPFENLTGDPGQDYFSDGLTEEMIAQLGRLDPEHLGVIARTSVMHYKHSQEQLERIGRELGVQYVLESSVRRDSDKVRVTTQLIQMKDQTHLWSRQYDRELSNLLALQGEIAQEIADEIQLTLDNHKRIEPAHQASLSPTAYEAYDLYLKGRYFWNKRTPQGLQRAIECFQQAIAKNPTYARAYAGLADSYTLSSGYNLIPSKNFMPKARAAALRALEIDDGLAEAHASLASIAQNYDWDWQTAEKEYQRAIQLDPNYATAHHWYAEYLALRGRFDEASAEMENARRLDPQSLIIAADNGAILYFSRNYDRAIEQLRAVLDMEPNFPRAHMVLYAYVQKGLFADAVADIENWRRIDETPWTWATLAYVYGRSGQHAQARHALEKLEQLNRLQQMDPAPLCVAYIGMGHKDEAFTCLQKAYSEHSNPLTALKVDPIYDPLRSDPRFQELLRRVGLVQ